MLEERVGVLALDRVGVDARVDECSRHLVLGRQAGSTRRAPPRPRRPAASASGWRSRWSRAGTRRCGCRRAVVPSRTAPGSVRARASRRLPTRCARGRGREADVAHVVRHGLSSHIRGSRSTSNRPTATAVSFETRTTSSCSTCSPKALVSEQMPSTACRARPPATLRAPSTCRRPSRRPNATGHFGRGLVRRSARRCVDADRRRDAERLRALEREVRNPRRTFGRADERRHAAWITPPPQRRHAHHV